VGSPILGLRRRQAVPTHQLEQADWPSLDGSPRAVGSVVVHPHLGEQTQQEQGPLSRSVVHEPAGVTWRLEARIDVPPCVPWVILAGKPHHESTQVRAGLPASGLTNWPTALSKGVAVAARLKQSPVGTPLTTDRRHVSGLAKSMPSCSTAERRHSSASSPEKATHDEVALSGELLQFGWL
jgi:hypothetical protein